MYYIQLQRTLLLISALALTACANDYVEPLAGHNLTYVTIHNDTDHEVILTYYASPELCSDPRDMGSIGPKDSITKTFEGDRHLTFGLEYEVVSYEGGQHTLSCAALGTIYVSEFPHYEIRFDFDKDKVGCYLTAFHFKNSVRNIEPRFAARAADENTSGACSSAKLP